MTILPSLAVVEPNGVNRFLPLPEFEKPYFVWRDETLKEQGGNSGVGRDTNEGNMAMDPYILSPFLTGRGRFVTVNEGQPVFNSGAWDNRRNYPLVGSQRENTTDGLVGGIALPLLADFFTIPDSPDLPLSNPFQAAGVNGWQIALAVQSSPLPSYRVYSAGGIVQGSPRNVDPNNVTMAMGAGRRVA